MDKRAIPKCLPINTGWNEVFNVGIDTATSVDENDYQVIFPFTSKLEKLTVKLGPELLSAAEQQKIAKVFRDQQLAPCAAPAKAGAVYLLVPSWTARRDREGRPQRLGQPLFLRVGFRKMLHYSA